MKAGEIHTPDGPWPRYQAKVGYTTFGGDTRWLAAFEFQASSDQGADSVARRLTIAIFGDTGRQEHEITRLP